MDLFNSAEEIVRQLRPDIPVTCFRPASVNTAAEWFLREFPGKTLYAVKANPSPFVLQELVKAGIRHFDAASLPEIEAVRAIAPDAFIAFMHPVKARSAIESAYFDHGIRDFSFDSVSELEKILSCTGNSKDLGLILRLSVPNTSAGLSLSGKFGCTPEDAPYILKLARKCAKRLGISFHVGSQCMDPADYITALGIVGGIMKVIPRTKIDIIDVGGGFPSAYPDMTPPDLNLYMDAIRQGIAALPASATREYWCEPGRALVAESGSVIVRVELRKDDALYINDGAYGSLFDAAHMGFKYPVQLLRETDTGFLPYRFYGPTCDSVDYMPGPFFLPADIKEGDYIEIGQLGAYGSALRTGFNGFGKDVIAAVLSPPLLTVYQDTATEVSETPDALCIA
jgi:ornithine decarboxylase